METHHKIYFKNSSEMSEIESDSIDLMITSPPYPMIKMWDPIFTSLNDKIKKKLEEENGKEVFNLMHEELNKVWNEVHRLMKIGGIICINIGDSTRKIGNTFQLYPNHVKVSNFFLEKDFIELPCILWRKPTNAPTKFLGSGMIPPNAYVTLEHEYILIFRKGSNTQALKSKSEKRYNSAYFWEERNKWFSDIWDDIKGTPQILNKTKENQKLIRERSGAYPLEIPYRLINMFSLYGDIILDPFWGTGTTTLASMISARNSIGYEINSEFLNVFKRNLQNIKQLNNDVINKRLTQHVNFIKSHSKKKEVKHNSIYYKFPVITKQERNIMLYKINEYNENKNRFIVSYLKYNFENS
jgi:DNA modification methylase